MKKFCIATGLVVLNLFPAWSQKTEIPEEEHYSFPNKCYYIELKEGKKLTKDTVSACSIVLEDVRSDSSKMGYYYDRKDMTKKILCSKNDISGLFQKVINSSLYFTNNTSDGKIFIYIKNLWINSILKPEKMTARGVDYKLWLKAEYYFVKEDKFYPLYRFDSLLTSNIRNNYRIEDFISSSIYESTKRLSQTIKTDFTNKKWISRQQVDSFNARNKGFAIFNEKVRKGIYMTIEDLQNNTPTYPEFSADFSEQADMLYVKGKTIPDSAIVDAFAFSDGKEIFIKQIANFFQLIRKGCNFEFFGFDKIYISKLTTPYQSGSGNVTRSAIEAGISGLLSQINVKRKFLQLLVLDIETGKYY